MNSMSGIVNRPAAIQFGRSRPPVPKTKEELLAEDDAVFIINQNIVDFDIPPTPNRGNRFWPLGILALTPAEERAAIQNQARAVIEDMSSEERAALLAAILAAILANDDEVDAILANDDEVDAILANDDEVDAILANDDEVDARPAQEMAVRLIEERAALPEDDGVGSPPALNREGESPPFQRHLRDDSNPNTNEDITPHNHSITNPLLAFAANLNPHSGESPFSNVQAGGHLTRQRETQRDRLMPTQEELNTIGGNALGGTPNSFNGFESEETSPRTPPPSPDGTLPLMPLSPSRQEGQGPRLAFRPAIRNSRESQNSRPGTHDSQPDPNQQTQPD
jgi:hypothetical protein